MGSIASVPSGISFLTQAGSGLLSELPVKLSASTLQSASAQDVVALSSAALQIQKVNGLFGITRPTQTNTSSLVFGAAPVDTNPATALASSQPEINLPTGVTAADLAGATPDQKATVANAANQQQLVQALFYPPMSVSSTTNVLG
jgi:hypothetical protein